MLISCYTKIFVFKYLNLYSLPVFIDYLLTECMEIYMTLNKYAVGNIYDEISNKEALLFKKVAVLKSEQSKTLTQKFSHNYCFHFRQRIESFDTLVNSRPDTIIHKQSFLRKIVKSKSSVLNLQYLQKPLHFQITYFFV